MIKYNIYKTYILFLFYIIKIFNKEKCQKYNQVFIFYN